MNFAICFMQVHQGFSHKYAVGIIYLRFLSQSEHCIIYLSIGDIHHYLVACLFPADARN